MMWFVLTNLERFDRREGSGDQKIKTAPGCIAEYSRKPYVVRTDQPAECLSVRSPESSALQRLRLEPKEVIVYLHCPRDNIPFK